LLPVLFVDSTVEVITSGGSGKGKQGKKEKKEKKRKERPIYQKHGSYPVGMIGKAIVWADVMDKKKTTTTSNTHTTHNLCWEERKE
jgi:hypothetical protein